jgi:hypothetical protein
MPFVGGAARRLVVGTAMNNTAFQELIAQIRGTAAELGKAEQKVAAFKAELAPQALGGQLDSAPQRTIQPIPKRNSGWLPAAVDTPVRLQGTQRNKAPSPMKKLAPAVRTGTAARCDAH